MDRDKLRNLHWTYKKLILDKWFLGFNLMCMNIIINLTIYAVS